jgi:hypothetical protein
VGVAVRGAAEGAGAVRVEGAVVVVRDDAGPGREERLPHGLGVRPGGEGDQLAELVGQRVEHPAGPAFGRKAQGVGQPVVDPVQDVVQVGVHRADGHPRAQGGHDGALHVIAAGQGLEAPEHDGVVGHDEVGARGHGFVHHGLGAVQAGHHAGHGRVRLAHQQAGVVVGRLVGGRRQGLEVGHDVGYADGIAHGSGPPCRAKAVHW